jgi:hypothetical protein
VTGVCSFGSIVGKRSWAVRTIIAGITISEVVCVLAKRLNTSFQLWRSNLHPVMNEQLWYHLSTSSTPEMSKVPYVLYQWDSMWGEVQNCFHWLLFPRFGWHLKFLSTSTIMAETLHSKVIWWIRSPELLWRSVLMPMMFAQICKENLRDKLSIDYWKVATGLLSSSNKLKYAVACRFTIISVREGFQRVCAQYSPYEWPYRLNSQRLFLSRMPFDIPLQNRQERWKTEKSTVVVKTSATSTGLKNRFKHHRL